MASSASSAIAKGKTRPLGIAVEHADPCQGRGCAAFFFLQPLPWQAPCACEVEELCLQQLHSCSCLRGCGQGGHVWCEGLAGNVVARAGCAEPGSPFASRVSVPGCPPSSNPSLHAWGTWYFWARRFPVLLLSGDALFSFCSLIAEWVGALLTFCRCCSELGGSAVSECSVLKELCDVTSL